MSGSSTIGLPGARGARAGAWAAGAVAVLLLAGVLLVLLERARWHMALVDVRFVDHREKVAGGGAALNVTGQLVLRVESASEIFRLARDENSYPEVQATACDTGQSLGAWRDPLPVERDAAAHRNVYAVLIPPRHREAELAQGGDVCLRFLAVGASLAPWAQSGLVRVALPDDVRQQMAAYARRKGVVDVTLDPGCAPNLCQPE